MEHGSVVWWVQSRANPAAHRAPTDWGAAGSSLRCRAWCERRLWWVRVRASWTVHIDFDTALNVFLAGTIGASKSRAPTWTSPSRIFANNTRRQAGLWPITAAPHRERGL